MAIPVFLRKLLSGPAGVLAIIAVGIGLLATLPEIASAIRVRSLQQGAYPEDWPLPDWRRRKGFATTALIVAGHRLTLPKFFITRARRGVPGAPEDAAREIEFEIRLPGFLPYGPNSAEQHAADPLGRLAIRLATGEEVISTDEKISRLVGTGRHQPPNPVADGKVHIAAKTAADDWAYAFVPGKGYALFAICDKGGEALCSARFVWRENVLVEYRFARERFLADWPAIDAKLRALLDSFAEP